MKRNIKVFGVNYFLKREKTIEGLKLDSLFLFIRKIIDVKSVVFFLFKREKAIEDKNSKSFLFGENIVDVKSNEKEKLIVKGLNLKGGKFMT